MTGINRVTVVGFLGRDPEVRTLNSGDSVCNLSIATSEEWKDKATGEKKGRTEWHRVVIFGKAADVAEKYTRKGALVGVEGKLQTRKWTDQSGQDRYTTEIVVDGFQGRLFLLGKGGGGSSRDDDSGHDDAPEQGRLDGNAGHNQTGRRPAGKTRDELDDEIPF